MTQIPCSADVEPDKGYFENGRLLRMLGQRVTYESGVYMILTCRPGFKQARFWRTMLGLGRGGKFAREIRAYDGDRYWSDEQVLGAWTMHHGRTHDNHWSEIAGREVWGSNCSCVR
ncbi:MAG TPA: hypothetical protein VFH17_08390 [Coriobacteriia bacterium]|nr:hypothetical protein [Coriobacteriia bacterium]